MPGSAVGAEAAPPGTREPRWPEGTEGVAPLAAAGPLASAVSEVEVVERGPDATRRWDRPLLWPVTITSPLRAMVAARTATPIFALRARRCRAAFLATRRSTTP